MYRCFSGVAMCSWKLIFGFLFSEDLGLMEIQGDDNLKLY